MAGSTEFQVNIIIKSKDRSSPETKKAKSGLDKLMKSAKQAASAFAALKAAQAAVNFVKMGAAVDRQARSLDALAKASGSSGNEIVSAIQGASDFTVDRMAAMQAANKAMLLDVAKSPAEFERLTKVAVALGRVMGQDAAKSLDDMTTAAGRQSIQIADNLGLIIRQVDLQDEVNRLMKENPALTDAAAKKQAFLNQMLVTGEAKLAAMGETTLDAAGKLEQIDAALSDAKTGFAEIAAQIIDATVDVSGFSKAMRELPSSVKAGQEALGMNNQELGEFIKRSTPVLSNLDQMTKSWNVMTTAIDDMQASAKSANSIIEGQASTINKSAEMFDQYSSALKETEAANEKAAMSAAELRKEQERLNKQFHLLTSGLSGSSERFNQYQNAIDTADRAMNENIVTIGDWRREQASLAKEQVILTQKTQEAALDQSIAWTQHFASVKEQQQENKSTIADIEEEHQAKLAELQKKGQARSIQINEVGEKAKLAALQKRLELALLQQSEFTGKTKASTQLAKENQIATLQSQIGTQTTLLDDYYNGRLIAQGANISTALAAENARYAEELALAKEQQTLQEEEQRQSLGRMLIQQFMSWAQLKQIPADKMLEMKNAIALEYGLITEESAAAANLMISDLEKWAASADSNTAEVAKSLGTVIDQAGRAARAAEAMTAALNNIPRNIDVSINVREAIGRRESQRGPGAGARFQRGADFTVPPGFNDNFPMNVSSGERVIVIPRNQNTTNNFTLNSSTRATQPRVDENFQMMAEMAA